MSNTLDIMAEQAKSQTLTKVLETFLDKLKVLPQNLENPTLIIF